MKLTVTKIDLHGRIFCRDERWSFCEVDPYIERCLPYDQHLERGDVIEIPDDSTVYRPTYLPSKIDIISKGE